MSFGAKRARNTESALITILTTILLRGNALEVTTHVCAYIYERYIFMHAHRVTRIHAPTSTHVHSVTQQALAVCEYTH